MFHREPKMIEYWEKRGPEEYVSNSETAYSVWKPYVKAGRETPFIRPVRFLKKKMKR